MNSKLTAERLARRAIVYVRQSSPSQVIHNQESQRRQYELADRARELGFSQVTVIPVSMQRRAISATRRNSALVAPLAACTPSPAITEDR
jgi:hypothetical protein